MCVSPSIDIVREPSIACTQHDITPGSTIDCSIQNYSTYIDVVIVKNDVEQFDKYPASHVCTPTIADRETAKCSIKLGDEGRFIVCVNYNSSVINNETLHQCSKSIHSISTWNRCKYYF